MIQLTRLNKSKIYINQDVITIIENTPETHITLVNGDHFIVIENVEKIIEKIIDFKSKIYLKKSEN